MTSTTADRPRTDDDLSYIAETMGQPRRQVAEAMGRTAQAITHMRRIIRNGDSRKTVRWSEYEDQVIRNSVGLRTSEEIAALLPGRSAYAVRGHISVLGLKLGYYASRSPLNIGERTLLAKTCSKCGLLLPAQWYNKRKFTGRRLQEGEAWRTNCRKCSGGDEVRVGRQGSVRTNAYKAEAQAITVPLAENNGKDYTEADHAILADETLTILAKALLLKRSYSAISNKTSDSGYKSHRGLGDAARDQWLIDNPNADRIDEITAMLNKVEPAMPTRPDFEWDD